MTRAFSLAVILVLIAGMAYSAPPERTDLTAEDLARVRKVTTPARDFSAPEKYEALSGGAGTNRKLFNRDAFSLFAQNLDFAGQERFNLGNGLFTKVWIAAPSSTQASDGLGPLFNARGCQNCHIKDGRGHPPIGAEDDGVSMFLRLSVPPRTEAEKQLLASGAMAVIPDPVYGTQLQNFAVPGLAAEGEMTIAWADLPVTLGDGNRVTLRAPTYGVRHLAYGPMAEGVMLSPRLTPQMIGLGLLEAIPGEDILALADPADSDGDGISGRPNWVVDPQTGERRLGRFGWKAGADSIRAQSAGAFAGDLGISTPAHNTPHGDCTTAQAACLELPTGEQARLGVSEAPDPVLDLVTFYAQHLAVPARRDVGDPAVLRGKAAFYSAGCASCHTPKFVTSRAAADPSLQFQLIWPYTDLLLHDMGPSLADNRPEGEASGTEWRTPPLWGIGLTAIVSGHEFYLHDGRARTLEEAILWHGGEAQNARDAYAGLSAATRQDLLAFLRSL